MRDGSTEMKLKQTTRDQNKQNMSTSEEQSTQIESTNRESEDAQRQNRGKHHTDTARRGFDLDGGVEMSRILRH